MNDTTRREFFSMLAALPFVGALFGKPENWGPKSGTYILPKQMCHPYIHGRIADSSNGKMLVVPAISQFHQDLESGEMAAGLMRGQFDKGIVCDITSAGYDNSPSRLSVIEWFSVTDRPPELCIVPQGFTEENAKYCSLRWSKELLVAIDGMIWPRFARWTGDSVTPDPKWDCFADIDSHGNAWIIHGVTHWAELPSPPENSSGT